MNGVVSNYFVDNNNINNIKNTVTEEEINSYESDLNNNLPSDYYEKVIDLENSLLSNNKDIAKTENLARLYKIGVENFTSTNNFKRADNFLKKLQDLLSKKKKITYQHKTSKNINNNLNSFANENANLKIDKIDFNSIEDISLESIKMIILKFDLNFNKCIDLVNQDLKIQQSNLVKNIKSKKKGHYTLNSSVSILFIFIILYLE